MKNYLRPVACILSAGILLTSCATSSITKEERKSAISKSREANTCCFVKLNDGTVKEYASLKLMTSPFATPYLLADGKTKIKPSEILAYQNEDHFAVSQRTFCCGRKSNVAIETLPGFAVRTVKGKLNVYCKKYYNGQTTVDEFYLQSGINGEIKVYSAELMNDLVKDHPEAYNLFNDKKFKGRFPEKLHATAEVYNGGEFMSKN